MNLYEITDMKTGKVTEPAIALREASEKLNCKSHVILNAYYGGHLANRRYRVMMVDETIKRKDIIWTEWDVCRKQLLKLCGGMNDGKKR